MTNYRKLVMLRKTKGKLTVFSTSTKGWYNVVLSQAKMDESVSAPIMIASSKRTAERKCNTNAEHSRKMPPPTPKKKQTKFPDISYLYLRQTPRS